MNPILETIELERRILKGLTLEWHSAASSLRHERGYVLSAPGFELSNMTSALGKWIPEKHIIVLSRRLVLDHPWLAVRDVLLHEIAHQLTDEILGGDSALHGGAFKKACAILGARPEASGSPVGLSMETAAGTIQPDDRILLRVQKLLSMAQSSNRHEAEAAMAKAYEHIARYNVDLLSLDERQRAYCSMCLGKPALRLPLSEYVLAGILREFYFVECIWIQAYVLNKGKMGKVLEVSGTAENVGMGGHVHAFIARTIDDQWTEFNRDRGLPLQRKTDFALGLLAGFREKLRAQEEAWARQSSPTFALIRKKDSGLTNYVGHRYPHLRRCGGSGRRIQKDVHEAGVEAGRRTILHKPIEHTRRSRGHLITS